jgi:hypothetical protein
MADGKADATLVAAAYRMGMANVPADTSKTFMRQYEALANIEVAKIQMQGDIIKSVGDLAETGIKAYTQVKIAKRQEKRDDEFDSGFIDVVDLVKSTLQEKGKNFSNYKENGQVADQTSIDYQKKKLETIKEELTRLKKSAKGNPENLTKIAKLEKKVIKWRDQTNKNVSDYKVHSELWLNDDVDMNTSFNVFNSKTGVEEFSPQMGFVYNSVMDPSVDLNDAGITPEERNGREGYLFNPKQDRLALEYKMSKASMLGYDPKAKPGLNRDDKGAGYGGGKIRLAQDRSKLAWISRDEMLSMVKKKDKDLPLELNGKMTEILLRMNGDNGKTGQKIDNGDGSFRFDKSKLKYNINAYSDIEARSEAEFYDIIMTPTTTVGKKQVSRDVKGGIAYISNNEITLGNTRINYGEMKQKDFNVDIAVINQIGIGSDIFTADELEDDKIDAAELEKHLGAKKEIFKVLFNPQTKQETEIAAREIAKFFNLQTKIKSNDDRGNISPAVSSLTLSNDPRNLQTYELKSIAIQNKFKAALKEGFTYENLQGLPIDKNKHFIERNGKIYLAFKTSQGKEIKLAYDNPIDLKNDQQVLNILYSNSDIRPNEQNIKVTSADLTAASNPITDYEKRGDDWYYIKGGKDNKVTNKKSIELINAKAKIAEIQGK